jgi:hypothetical protein
MSLRIIVALQGALLSIIAACFSTSVSAQVRLPLSASTPAQFANLVSEVRIFATTDPQSVIGEVVVTGATSLTEITLTLERGPVRFVDNGAVPDKRRGDGVFTARFSMNTGVEFRRWQDNLRRSTDAILGDGMALITRSPRVNVRASEVLAAWRKAGGRGLDTLAERTRAIVGAPNLYVAAQSLGFDLTNEPMYKVMSGSAQLSDSAPGTMLATPFFVGLKPPIPIDHYRSLLVIKASVLEDPVRTYDACSNTGTQDGIWSFGHLIRELAENTGITPEVYLQNLLDTWVNAQSANGIAVYDATRAASMQSRVMAAWQQFSGPVLDVDKFPARLLGIVNRPDLADKVGYSAAGTAGEGRFVFGLEEMTPMGCRGMKFTIILEYGIKGGSCTAVKNWHQRWKNLDTHALGSAAYRNALAAITVDFTEAGVNPAQLPNQSALLALRTGESGLDSLNPFPSVGSWQFRQFHLVADGQLGLTTIAQTPDDAFNNSNALAQYLVENESDILQDKHVVPEKYPDALTSFLGAKADLTPSFNTNFWNADLTALANPAETRRKFSLATCDACHDRETDTKFSHLGQLGHRWLGGDSEQSYFLNGGNPFLFVPVTGGHHLYDDLGEREKKMSDILNQTCFELVAVKKPLALIH